MSHRRMRVFVLCRQKVPGAGPEQARGLGSSVARRVERSVGGVQVHAANVARYLTAAGHDVVTVTPWDSSPGLAVGATVVSRLLARVSPSLAERWQRRWNLALLTRALVRRHDGLSGEPATVFYAQDELTAEAALRVRRPSSAVVMAVHNAGSEANELWWDGLCGLGDRVYRRLREHHDRISAQVDGVLAVSKIGAEGFFLHTERGRELHHRVVYSFVDDDWRVRPGAPASERRDLVTVGALNATKNHRYLLEVLAETNRLGHHYSLTIVGNGPERDSLRSLVRSLDIDDQVAFLGARHDISRILSEHRAYIHTSRMESGFPLAVIEAMAQGLPVIAAPVGAIPEMLRDGTDGRHIPLHSAEAAAKILVAFLEDREMVECCGHHAAERFRAEFRASVGGARIEAFFGEVLRCRAGAYPERSPD